MKQKYQLETITPVHIGSGELLNHIDGCYVNGMWYHIDLDKVIEHPNTDVNKLTSEMSRRGFRWNQFLSQNHMDAEELSDYSLPCTQSPEEVDIREAIKSIGNRPYIPGSSLKGALRNLLLAHILGDNEENYKKSQHQLELLINQKTQGNPRGEQPAQQIEKIAFGKNPNHDLLRTLQVSDTEPLLSDVLEIGTAWTVTINSNNRLVKKINRGTEYKNFVQQIKTSQTLTFTIKIDDLLFREREKEQLGFTDFQLKSLQEIPEICHYLTAQYLHSEQDFLKFYKLPEIAKFYDKLTKIHKNLSDEEFLMQIGWGTGYNAKTVTELFTNDAELPVDWMDLRERFRLGESRSTRGEYDEHEFPKTRRILYRGQNPISPLGWVKISPFKD